MENPKRCPKGTRRKYINGSKTEFICVKDTEVQKNANTRRKEKYQKQNKTTKQKYDIREVIKKVKKPQKEESFPLTPEEKYPSPISEEPTEAVSQTQPVAKTANPPLTPQKTEQQGELFTQSNPVEKVETPQKIEEEETKSEDATGGILEKNTEEQEPVASPPSITQNINSQELEPSSLEEEETTENAEEIQIPELLTEQETKQFSKSERQQELRKEKIEYEKGETPAGLYPNLNDKNFINKITNKKEFFETQYDPTIYEIEKQADVLCNLPVEFHPHQTFVRNFLSSETPYKSMLLYHGLGTGKTATAIGVAEEMRQYMRQTGVIKKIFIIASSNVRDNFHRELFNEDLIPEDLKDLQSTVFPFYMGEIIKEVHPTADFSGITRDELIGRVKSLIRQFYHFQGYRKMAIDIFRLIKYENGILTERSKQSLRNRFNDTLLIVDEVHNIRANSENDLEMKKIGELLTVAVSNSDNLRLLLMSATPVFNSYLEIIWLTNLLNLNDKRPKIKTSEVFYVSGEREGEFRDAQTLDNGVVIEGGEALLKRKLTGYVSFVRGENPYSFPYRLYPDFFAPQKTYDIEHISQKTLGQNIPLPTEQFNGQEIPVEKRLKYIRLYVNTIGEYQKKVYENLLEKGANTNVLADLGSENKKTGTEKQSLLKLQPIIQSLNIVYPNENDPISDAGFNSIMVQERQQFRYAPGKERIFSPSEIGKYSCKIAAVLEAVINSTGIVLVYSQFLKSGIVSLALALEESGITRFNGPPLLKDTPSVDRLDALTMKPDPNTQNQAKYILVSGSKTYSPDNLSAIQEAVKIDNKDGKNVKVILISGAGSEGIDFKFIRQVHILEPWYNMNKMEQIVGRAVRHKSHCALPFQQRNVEIYYHTVGLDEGKEALDTFIYRHYAETKAVQIGKINRLLKEISVDVLLNIGQMNMTVEKLQTLSANQSIKIQIPSGTKELKFFPIGDKPHTETCDYMECRYTDKTAPSGYALDRQTYGETYIKRSNSVLVPKIKALFRESAFYTKNDLLLRLNSGGKTYPLEQIYSALSYLSSPLSNEFLVDKNGRIGRLVVRGSTFVFLPEEKRGQTNLSLMETAIPTEYLKGSVLVELPTTTSVRRSDVAISKKTETTEKDFVQEYKQILETEGSGSVWFTELFKKQRVGKTGGEFSAYNFLKGYMDEETLKTVLVQHYLESLPYSEKVQCLKHVVSENGEETNIFREYFQTNSAIVDKEQQVYYLYNLEEKKQTFWVLEEGEWQSEDDTTQLSVYYTKYARQKKNVFVSVSPVFGYMDWNAKKERVELKTKKKGGGDKYNKGNFCVNQNKSSELNKMLLLEFPPLVVLRDIEHVSVYSGCVITEVLLRKKNMDKGKTYFFSPEEYFMGIV